MKYDFKFAHKDQVIVLEYNEPRQSHNAVVLSRWLEEDEQNELKEHYEVLLQVGEGDLQRCEFLSSDITNKD